VTRGGGATRRPPERRRGRATVAGESVPLREGTLVCIEAGETHEIECTGEATLRVVTVYAPPVY
jgi:mannose-6-phosphate isomerase-like protein (cupin superfamily)